MIVTDKIRLSSKEFFNLLIMNFLKKRWWLVAWIWIMIIILLFRENKDNFEYFIIAALILIQGAMVYQYWGYANSISNSPFLQERHYEIDSEKIVGITADGSISTFAISDFTRIAKTAKYYLLYTSKTEYIYIPFSSFKTDLDKEWFEKEVVMKIK